MKKTKKILMWFGVVVTLFTPVFSTLSVLAIDPPPSSAQSSTPTLSANDVEAALKSTLYMRGIADCIDQNRYSGVGQGIISGDAATSWKFFTGGVTQLGLYGEDQKCNDPTFVQDAYGLWGIGDSLTAMCSSGFGAISSTSGLSKAGDVQACLGAPSDATYHVQPAGGVAVSQFVKYIDTQYYQTTGGWPTWTDPMRYLLYRYDFEKLCQATQDSSVTDQIVAHNTHAFKLTDADGSTQLYYTAKKSKSNTVKAYIQDDLTAKSLSCQDLTTLASKYALGYANQVSDGLPTSQDSTDLGASADIGINCGGVDFTNSDTNPLDWVTCPLASIFAGFAGKLDSEIGNMLCVNEADIFSGATATCSSEGGNVDSASGFYAAWNTFRLLAMALLVIGGLVMVVSQALGFEVFDAYTVKRVLPRILIAGVLISLSWKLLEFVVMMSNALGVGIRALIYAPFINAGTGSVNLGAGSDFSISSILALSGWAVYGVAGLLSFVATAALAILVAFLVIVLRNVVVIMLIILAPVAIAAYILPNTEKYARTWWEWLFKALLMFPLITGFIAVGHVFAAVAATKSGTINSFIALAAYVLPYFLIPLTFRLAGGAISTIGGLANDRSRGAFDRLKKFRGAQAAKNIEAMGAGNRLRGSDPISRSFNRVTGGVAGIARADKGLNPMKWRSSIQASMSNHSLDQAAEYGEKNHAFQSIKGNDDLLTAALKHGGNERGMRNDLLAKGYSDDAASQGIAAIRLARRDTSEEVFESAAAMALPATGTAFGKGAGEMHNVINEVAGGDRQKAARMLAAMRSGAASARRFDIAGGSYGQQLMAMEEQYAAEEAFKQGGTAQITDADGQKVTVSNKQQATAVADEKIVRQSLQGQGGSYVVGARNGAVKNFAPIMREQLDAAVIGGNDLEINRELAKIAGRYDAMASVAPENAEVMASEVLGATLISASRNSSFVKPDGNAMTVREMIETQRGNPDFLNMRKEYGQAGIAGAAQAQQAAIQAQIYGQQGPNGPATPPPLPPVVGP